MKFVIYSIIAVVAIVAAVVAFRFSDQTVPEKPVVQETPIKEINIKTVDVLVARSNIPVGSIIDNSMIDKQPWPENLVLEGFVVSDSSGRDNIVGKVARNAIQAHEPFMKSKLANPNDPGFLAANLPVGMRAITIATDVVSGIAGFVFPGDHVDILFTHDPIPSDGTSSRPEFTEVIGSSIRVLGVNVRDSGDNSRPAAVAPSSVTLEVTDSLAQHIRLAEKNGTLSLALRSIRDDGSASPSPTGLADLSSATLSKPLAVVRGPGSSGGGIKVSDYLGSLSAGDDSAEVIRGANSGAAQPPVANTGAAASSVGKSVGK